MKIELLGWKSSGLRCPDTKIELSDANDHVPKVALIQMPNGTGKTTTLDCLRAAMDGSAAQWSEEKVLSYRNQESIPDEGLFLAWFRVDGTKRLFIEMSFDFEYGSATYKTTFASNNSEGYNPPPEVRRFFDQRFSELLFFNGELSNDLINGNRNINASNIIDTFYGLYYAKELSDQAEQSYQAFVKTKKSSGRSAQLGALETSLKKLRVTRDDLQKQLDEAASRRTILRDSVAILERETEEHILQNKKYRQQEKGALAQRSEAQQAVRETLQLIAKDFPNPIFLHDPLRSDLVELAENLDTLRLPETTSRAFFSDLLDQDVCICGRPMDHDAKASIAECSSTILGENVNGFSNSLKSEVDKLCQLPQEPSFQSLLTELKTAQDCEMDAESRLRDIQQQAAASGDEELVLKREELDRKKSQIEQLDAKIENISRSPRASDEVTSDCLEWYEQKIKKSENRKAELTDSLAAKARKDCLIQVLDSAYKQAHENLKRFVIEQANDQLKQILRFNPVQIAEIDQKVELEGRGSGSVGQNLSVGYVFLAGLLHGGGHQFPLVVDSPAGSLDDVTRKEVGSLLPQLVGQLVGFVIASEREWFVEPLSTAANEDVLYVTHLRLNDYTRELVGSLGGDVTHRSDNGIVIGGKDAFFRLGDDAIDES